MNGMTDQQIKMLGRAIGDAIGAALVSEFKLFTTPYRASVSTLERTVRAMGTAIGEAIAKGKP